MQGSHNIQSIPPGREIPLASNNLLFTIHLNRRSYHINLEPLREILKKIIRLAVYIFSCGIINLYPQQNLLNVRQNRVELLELGQHQPQENRADEPQQTVVEKEPEKNEEKGTKKLETVNTSFVTQTEESDGEGADNEDMNESDSDEEETTQLPRNPPTSITKSPAVVIENQDEIESDEEGPEAVIAQAVGSEIDAEGESTIAEDPVLEIAESVQPDEAVSHPEESTPEEVIPKAEVLAMDFATVLSSQPHEVVFDKEEPSHKETIEEDEGPKTTSSQVDEGTKVEPSLKKEEIFGKKTEPSELSQEPEIPILPGYENFSFFTQPSVITKSPSQDEQPQLGSTELAFSLLLQAQTLQSISTKTFSNSNPSYGPSSPRKEPTSSFTIHSLIQNEDIFSSKLSMPEQDLAPITPSTATATTSSLVEPKKDVSAAPPIPEKTSSTIPPSSVEKEKPIASSLPKKELAKIPTTQLSEIDKENIAAAKRKIEEGILHNHEYLRLFSAYTQRQLNFHASFIKEPGEFLFRKYEKDNFYILHYKDTSDNYHTVHFLFKEDGSIQVNMHFFSFQAGPERQSGETSTYANLDELIERTQLKTHIRFPDYSTYFPLIEMTVEKVEIISEKTPTSTPTITSTDKAKQVEEILKKANQKQVAAIRSQIEDGWMTDEYLQHYKKKHQKVYEKFLLEQGDFFYLQFYNKTRTSYEYKIAFMNDSEELHELRFKLTNEGKIQIENQLYRKKGGEKTISIPNKEIYNSLKDLENAYRVKWKIHFEKTHEDTVYIYEYRNAGVKEDQIEKIKRLETIKLVHSNLVTSTSNLSKFHSQFPKGKFYIRRSDSDPSNFVLVQISDEIRHTTFKIDLGGKIRLPRLDPEAEFSKFSSFEDLLFKKNLEKENQITQEECDLIIKKIQIKLDVDESCCHINHGLMTTDCHKFYVDYCKKHGENLASKFLIEPGDFFYLEIPTKSKKHPQQVAYKVAFMNHLREIHQIHFQFNQLGQIEILQDSYRPRDGQKPRALTNTRTFNNLEEFEKQYGFTWRACFEQDKGIYSMKYYNKLGTQEEDLSTKLTRLEKTTIERIQENLIKFDFYHGYLTNNILFAGKFLIHQSQSDPSHFVLKSYHSDKSKGFVEINFTLEKDGKIKALRSEKAKVYDSFDDLLFALKLDKANQLKQENCQSFIDQIAENRKTIGEKVRSFENYPILSGSKHPHVFLCGSAQLGARMALFSDPHSEKNSINRAKSVMRFTKGMLTYANYTTMSGKDEFPFPEYFFTVLKKRGDFLIRECNQTKERDSYIILYKDESDNYRDIAFTINKDGIVVTNDETQYENLESIKTAYNLRRQAFYTGTDYEYPSDDQTKIVQQKTETSSPSVSTPLFSLERIKKERVDSTRALIDSGLLNLEIINKLKVEFRSKKPDHLFSFNEILTQPGDFLFRENFKKSKEIDPSAVCNYVINFLGHNKRFHRAQFHIDEHGKFIITKHISYSIDENGNKQDNTGHGLITCFSLDHLLKKLDLKRRVHFSSDKPHSYVEVIPYY